MHQAKYDMTNTVPRAYVMKIKGQRCIYTYKESYSTEPARYEYSLIGAHMSGGVPTWPARKFQTG